MPLLKANTLKELLLFQMKKRPFFFALKACVDCDAACTSHSFVCTRNQTEAKDSGVLVRELTP